jgi:cytochrome b6-f complex iron-sulfur subunit
MNEASEHQGQAGRRDFLGRAAFWTTAGALGFAGLGIARMPKPGVLPGQASAIKVGTPGDYPVGSDPVRVAGQNLFVIHDAGGFGAIASVCTHLGCIVAVNPDGFACPCHGSRFARDGRVTQGPAPSPLTWFEMALAPDGQMLVDAKKPVPAGTRFQFSEPAGAPRRGGVS